MSQSLKAQWEALRRGKSGQRFQKRYEASRREKSRRSMVSRIVRWVLAMIAVAIGIVLMFIPGPAVLFFALAGALLASESKGVARFLDWSEVKTRKVVMWARGIWRRLPLAGKAGAMLFVAAGAAGAAYASYWFFVKR